MKNVILFSGGASSAYMAKMIIEECGKQNIILLHTPTYAESPDADRFRDQVADFLGMRVHEQADGRSLWQLIEENNCLPSYHIPFCTTELKIKQSRKFFKSLNDDFIVYVGYGADEWRRVQKQSARFEQEGIKARYPIFENRISNSHIKNTIKNDWKICLPETYKYLKHNNCLPCFKGGVGHFKMVAKYYPEQFLKAMYLEEKIGHTVFKDRTLKSVWDEVENQKDLGSLIDEDYGVPCMCAA